MDEENLYDLSDEELEAAFKEAKADEGSPEIDTEMGFDNGDAEVDDTDSTDEEFDNDLEQPTDNEDSDHDGEEDADAELDDEDVSNSEEDTSDGESDEEATEPTEDNKEDEDDSQVVQKYKVKADGQEFEFTPDEIMDKFPSIFGQAMNYTKKMQAIKPWRKTIDAIEEAKLEHNDINLMIDVLKGDKDAIAEVLKRTGVDTLDLDTDGDSKYIAKDYGRDENALAIKDIVDSISNDEAYPTTQNILSNQWDERSIQEMTENPEMINLLHVDVQSGMYDTIAPIANKLKVYDGGRKSDLDYYKDAARQHFNELSRLEALQQDNVNREAEQQRQEQQQERVERVKADTAKREATKKASAKRKAAAPSTNSVGKAGVVDYLDDSDEAFDEWYKNLQDSV